MSVSFKCFQALHPTSYKYTFYVNDLLNRQYSFVNYSELNSKFKMYSIAFNELVDATRASWERHQNNSLNGHKLKNYRRTVNLCNYQRRLTHNVSVYNYSTYTTYYSFNEAVLEFLIVMFAFNVETRPYKLPLDDLLLFSTRMTLFWNDFQD